MAYHSVETPGFLEDLVDGALDGVFFCYVCLDGEDLARVLFRYGGEFITRLANVDGVDFCGAVGETAVCYPEADSWCCQRWLK